MWKYKNEFSEAENKENVLRVKRELEALAIGIDAIVEFKVYINELASSNMDVVLNSLFESEAALSAYQMHPEHQRVGAYVGTVLQERVCIDYYE